MKTSSILASVGIFTLLAAVGGGLAYFKYTQIQRDKNAPRQGEPPTSVEVVKVREITWQPTSDLVGTVLALRSVSVSTELAGVITKIGFDSGGIVEEGAVLLSMDDAEDRANLAEAESTVKVAEANVAVADTKLRLAETELRRMGDAVRVKAMSDIDLDRASAELDRAKADRSRLTAEVEQAKARVAQVSTKLDKRFIRAPFRARAGLRNVHAGQYLAEGASVVLLQEVSDTINLDFAIPQEFLARVSPGAVVMATGPLLGPKPIEIRVVAVDAAVNNTTRNVRVRTIVDNKDDRLRPGMFIQIRVPVEEPKTYLAIPRNALRRTSYADQVFLVVRGEKPEELRAKQQYITLGPTLGEDVIVLKGLELGQEIAASGSFKLRDGGPVMIAAPTPPTTPAAPASK
jgi:membrane fusion protein (multidrug efflux system)